MIGERGRDIKGYEDFYQVSDKGQVKSLNRVVLRSNGKTQRIPDRILKPTHDKAGYEYVILQKEGERVTKKVHRLVAQTF